MHYINRLIDSKIKSYLKTFGAVLVEGPKYCGKTRSCEELSNTKIYFQNPVTKKRYKSIIEEDPSLLLNDTFPILLDEWQEYPVLWDTVRYKVDQLQQKGCFLLTGSSQSRIVKTMHSGTGRIAHITMRPMSLFESKYVDSNVSISKLFNGETITSSKCSLTLKDYMEIICRGGWPGSRELEIQEALNATYEYVSELYTLPISFKKALHQHATINSNLLSSIARNILTQVSFSKILNEVITNSVQLTDRTVYNYYEKLKNYFIVEDVEAWNPHIRSKARLTTSPKHNFIDPSIAIGALRLNPDSLINDLEYYGFLFESLCIRDLRILVDNLGGEIFYYGDNTGLDIDAIIQLKDGRWGAIQVKVGSSKIDQASNELDLFIDKLDFKKINKPSFLMILTGTEYSYQRKDGKFVVPLGLLEP
jgi:predicted AAA+ superfamily ATPase